MARARFLVFTNPVSADKEAEFNDWYSNAHLGDVVAVPGVIRAQRFRLTAIETSGTPSPMHRYLAVYELETDDPGAFSDELDAIAGTDAMPISDALDIDGTVASYWAPIGPAVEKPRDSGD